MATTRKRITQVDIDQVLQLHNLNLKTSQIDKVLQRSNASISRIIMWHSETGDTNLKSYKKWITNKVTHELEKKVGEEDISDTKKLVLVVEKNLLENFDAFAQALNSLNDKLSFISEHMVMDPERIVAPKKNPDVPEHIVATKRRFVPWTEAKEKDDEEEKQVHKCEICTFTSTDPLALEKHLKDKHGMYRVGNKLEKVPAGTKAPWWRDKR